MGLECGFERFLDPPETMDDLSSYSQQRIVGHQILITNPTYTSTPNSHIKEYFLLELQGALDPPSNSDQMEDGSELSLGKFNTMENVCLFDHISDFPSAIIVIIKN